MFRVVVLCVAALWLPAQAQPVSCREDAQCSDGYYCETDAHICRECLSCEDLKREPPAAVNTCIKSVAECGACINELVVDRRTGDVNSECVKPDLPREGTNPYVWVIVTVVLLFAVFAVGIIIAVYLVRNPDIFKSDVTAACTTTATAPEAPPPYNPLPPPLYHNTSPYPERETTTHDEEEQFIKPPSSRPQNMWESAGNQAARVFNPAIYDQPPSAESPVPDYPESTPFDHEDETVPSPWMPGPMSNGDVNANVVNDNNANESEGAAATLPALLAAARDTTLVEHSPAKKKCVRQDSRESNCGDSSNSSFPRPPSPGQGGPPYSFFTHITNVVQINTNK